MYLWILLAIMIIVIAIVIIMGVKKTPIRPAPRKQTAKAITFGGGGFRSVVNFSAVMTGVLEVGNKTKDIHLNEMLNSFDVVSCVSGGTIFFHYLSHSKRYYDMIDKSARGEQALFGDCDNLPVAKYGLCLEEEMDNCTGVFNTLCCCKDGYRAVSSGCEKCQEKPYMTLNKWIGSYSKVFAEALNESSEKYENWLVNLILSNLNEDQYLAYILLTGNDDFDSIFKSIIMHTIDDFDRNMKLGSNVNGLTSTVTINSTILSQGYLGDTKYSIGNGDVMSYPVNMVYKADGNGDEFLDRRFFKDKELEMITYSLNGEDITVELPSRVNVHDMTVGQGCQWSGSAFGVVSSNIFLEQLLSDLYIDPYDYDILGVICDKPGCDIPEYLSHKYRIFSPVTYIPSGSEYPIPQYGSEILDHSKTEYEQKMPLKMGDGAFNTDVEGVTEAIYELQQKFDSDTHLKVVSFCKTDDEGIGPDILSLFGKAMDCNTNLEKVGDVDTAILGSINLRKSNLQVFDSGGCEYNKTLFEMTHSPETDYFSPEFKCNMFDMCEPRFKVIAWSGLTTTENRIRGIKAGYKVDLILVATYVPSLLDKIAALPGDQIWKMNQSLYSIAANRLSRSSYEAARNMPEKVYDVVFGDADYFPSDF